MNIIRETSISDQDRPLLLCIVIICFKIVWTSHRCIVRTRLVSSRLEEGIKMFGTAMIRITTGSPIRVGVMKEANRFSFILNLKGFLTF